MASAIRFSNQEKLYLQMHADFIDDADVLIRDNANVQLDAQRVIESGDDWDGWGAHMDEFPGTVNDLGNFMDPYTRVVPEHLTGNTAISGVGSIDLFTENVLKNYAVEDKTEDGTPTGELWITKDTGLKLAEEVACTHYKLCGDEGVNWLTSVGPYTGEPRYDAAWDYYDVNKEGKIHAVGQSGSMLRHLFRPLGWLDI